MEQALQVHLDVSDHVSEVLEEVSRQVGRLRLEREQAAPVALLAAAAAAVALPRRVSRRRLLFPWLAAALVLAVATPAAAQLPPDAWRAAVSGQATTAAYILSLEPTDAAGFRISEVCVSSSSATAAAAVTVTVSRRTTASTGGTLLTAEGTGTTTVSKLRHEMAANFPGIARLGGTPGTIGAVVDQWSFAVGELGAGAADTAGPPPQCKRYDPMISVGPGAASNGLAINVSAAGAGGLATGSISAVILLGQ